MGEKKDILHTIKDVYVKINIINKTNSFVIYKLTHVSMVYYSFLFLIIFIIFKTISSEPKI